jgi:hypothetical protein
LINTTKIPNYEIASETLGEVLEANGKTQLLAKELLLAVSTIKSLNFC